MGWSWDLKGCLIFAFHHPVLAALQGEEKKMEREGKEVKRIKRHIPACDIHCFRGGAGMSLACSAVCGPRASIQSLARRCETALVRCLQQPSSPL